MTKPVKWKLAPKAMRTLLGQDGVNDMVGELTNKVESRAQTLARSEAYDTGAYLDSIKSRIERSRNGDRPVGVVQVDDPKWIFIEYGTRGRPGKAILRRAMNELKGKK